MFTSKIKPLFGLLCLMLLAFLYQDGLTSFIEHANAQTTFVPGTGVTSAGNIGEGLRDILTKVAAINTFLHVLLLLSLQFVGYFLQADFFNDTQMMTGLYTIWSLSRNIMNVLFALMLIAVSIYVIITAKTDMIKEKIVQFVIAVVLVNMSWFFPRVVLDVANVLTATVFSIPSMLPTPDCVAIGDDGNPTPCKVVTAVLLFPKAGTSDASDFCAKHAGAGPATASCPCIDSLECHALKNYDDALRSGGMKPAHAMINGLAISFVHMTTLAKIPTSISGVEPIDAARAADISIQIAINILLAFVVQAALFLPLLGLAVGLLIRILIIWVTTAFMPFVFLGYVKNGTLGTDVFGFEVNIWTEFVNAAFLPAVVGLPMTIGFILLNTVTVLPPPGGMPFETIMPLLAGIQTWWQFLWMFVAVAIIWKGSFDALAKSKIASTFTEKIRGFGQTIAGGVAQLPLLTPIPLPGMPNANLGTLVNSPRIASDALRFATSGHDFANALQTRLSGGVAGAGVIPGASGLTAQQLAVEVNKQDEVGRKITEAIDRLKNATDNAGKRAALNELRAHTGETSDLGALNKLQQMQGHVTNTILQQRLTIDLPAMITREQNTATATPANP